MRYFQIFLVGLVFAFFGLGGQVHASFNKNKIILDSVFNEQSTMTASEIQSFLNSFPSSCLKSYQAPYPNGYDSYGSNVSAATVVRRVSDIYQVNPQVILATLQKESSLVSGNDGCASWRYNSAMGMACPDGGQCPAPGYEGFSKQVTKGTWLLRFGTERAKGNVTWEANDGVGGDYNISYGGPMTEGCHKRNIDSPMVCYDGYTTIDSQSIYISTGSTGSFYNYTPHLHGNELFVSIFEGWFGPTTPDYHSQDYQRCCHTTAFPGETVTNEFWFKNTGNVNWYDQAGLSVAPPGTTETMLYTTRPLKTPSPLGNLWTAKTLAGRNFSAVYESNGTTLASNQHTVQPGQIAKYNVDFYVPTNLAAGDYVTWVQLATPGNWSAFNDPGSWLKVTVSP